MFFSFFFFFFLVGCCCVCLFFKLKLNVCCYFNQAGVPPASTLKSEKEWRRIIDGSSVCIQSFLEGSVW